MPVGRVARPRRLGLLGWIDRLGSSSRRSDRRRGGVADSLRFYGDAMKPSEVEPFLTSRYLTARQRLILGCIFTRHHNGYVRQQWMRAVVPHAEPWVVPFVLALLGEYVVEIVVDMCRALHALGDPRSATAAVYRDVLSRTPVSSNSPVSEWRVISTATTAECTSNRPTIRVTNCCGSFNRSWGQAVRPAWKRSRELVRRLPDQLFPDRAVSSVTRSEQCDEATRTQLTIGDRMPTAGENCGPHDPTGTCGLSADCTE